jgi:hypothetical protein
MRKRIPIFIALIFNATPAAAEMLYLKCTGGPDNVSYVTVDLTRGAAKLSSYPADDYEYSKVNITSSTIRWNQYEKVFNTTITLNRYSGDLDYYSVSRVSGMKGHSYYKCDRTEPPSRRY